MKCKVPIKETGELTVPIELSECLAKTEVYGCSVAPGLTVEEHCAVTGYVAGLLSEISLVFRDKGFDYNSLRLLASIHDIGKVSLPFQSMIYSALSEKGDFEKAIANKFSKITNIHHTTIGKAFADDVLYNSLVADIIWKHHGKAGELSSPDDSSIYGGMQFSLLRKELFTRLCKLFGDVFPKTDSFAVKQMLLGFVTVSDWISSTVSKGELASSSPEKVARDAFKNTDIQDLSFEKDKSFEAVFGFKPRPVQSLLSEAVTGPGVYILEAGMGQGKTEAALYAAYKLISEGKANGIYFALPTQLTSLAINSRVEKYLSNVGPEEHSRLIFSNSELYLGEEGDVGGSWFDSRKKSILAPVGVGTVDQALMSVINVKHSAVRTYGLAGKVVILDEVHSYDTFTGTLICELIRELKELGSTIIILSATLQSEAKKNILSLKEPSKIQSYPLVTKCVGDVVSEFSVDQKPESSDIKIGFTSDERNAYTRAVECAENGCYVLWIENTVKEAQHVFSVLKSQCSPDFPIALIHSRFTKPDRREKECEWVNVFGPEGFDKRKEQKKGCILVGTQVLEQSLDIDADILFTRIAPIDMLFQRMGRLWRHKDYTGSRHINKPEVIILAPSLDKAENVIDAYGDSAGVYSPYVLYKTQRELMPRAVVTLPDDIRGMIEKVYDSSAVDYSPVIIAHKKELEDKVEKLRHLALNERSSVISTMNDDEAVTRYSDYPTADILLVKDIDWEGKRVKFLERNIWYRLDGKKDRELALELFANRIQISQKVASKIPEADEKIKSIFYPHMFIPEGGKLYIVIVEENGSVKDLYGNLLEGFYYRKEIGFVS